MGTIFIENLDAGRKIIVKASDTFTQDPQNIRITIGSECYALVSTKTDTDRDREKLSTQFASDRFETYYKEGLTPEDVKRKIAVDLERDEYKELRDISNTGLLTLTLSTSYATYFVVQNNMKQVTKEIDEGKKDDNVFFDYLYRLQDIVEKSETLAEFHKAVFRLRDISAYDERGAVGMTVVLDTVSEVFREEKTVSDEILRTMKTKSNMLELPIFNDKEYWKVHFEKSIANAKINIQNTIVVWKEVAQRLGSEPADGKFNHVLKSLINGMASMVTVLNKYIQLIDENKDAVAIETAKKTVEVAIPVYLTHMRNVEITERVDPRSYSSEYDEKVYNIIIACFKNLETALIEQTSSTGEVFDWRSYVKDIEATYYLAVAIYYKYVDPVAYLEKKYTTEQLNTIISQMIETLKLTDGQTKKDNKGADIPPNTESK